MGGHNAYSASPASNTAINGLGVSDSTVPNTLDNIIRQQMADVRTLAEDIGGKNVSSGTDTITLTTSSTVTAYYDGLRLAFIAGGTNTGAATLNVDGVGAKAVRKGADVALGAGDITAAMPVDVVYDASANSAAGAFMLFNPSLGALQPLDADLTTLATAFTTASASGAASLKFAEDTDNGTNAVTLQGAASTADVTITLPATTGTAALTSDFIGQQTIWVPATAMTPRTTNGAAIGSLETTTNDVMMSYLAFDATTAEGAQFGIQMPKGWDESTLIAQFVWTHPATTTNFGVVFELSAVAFADDDALDTAFGTSQEIADTGGTTHDTYVTAETPAITVAGTPGAEEYVMFQVARDPANGSDTLAVDAWLLGVKIHYTTSAAKDD